MIFDFAWAAVFGFAASECLLHSPLSGARRPRWFLFPRLPSARAFRRRGFCAGLTPVQLQLYFGDKLGNSVGSLLRWLKIVKRSCSARFKPGASRRFHVAARDTSSWRVAPMLQNFFFLGPRDSTYCCTTSSRASAAMYYMRCCTERALTPCTRYS